MYPFAPRVCSEPGGQKQVLSLSLDLISAVLLKPSCDKVWCKSFFCFFFTKDKYTDIFIFIYWMQCRTLDTNTINTWFPWIPMNQNWRLSRTFQDQFVHYKNFQGKFQKAHIYVMANIIKFSFWFVAKGLKDIRQYQCRQWLQVINKTIPEPLMTGPNAIYDITRPHWVNISIWLSMPHTHTQMQPPLTGKSLLS